MRFDPRTRALGNGPSSLVQNWMRTGIVRSVQRGTIVIANTELTHDATLGTAILPQNTVLSWLGDVNLLGSGSVEFMNAMAYLTLVDGVTVRATRQFNSNVVTISYQVVEYAPGVLKSNQSDIITLGASASGTATITAVDPAKAQLFWLGTSTTDDATVGLPGVRTTLALTNATTVTASRTTAVISDIVSFQVIEFN